MQVFVNAITGTITLDVKSSDTIANYPRSYPLLQSRKLAPFSVVSMCSCIQLLDHASM
jgi:hypothetical protein